MFGLTPLGIVHTLISLVAVGAALVAFARDGRITPRNTLGQVYLWTTVFTCLTGFGIFQHGGFGKPHVLGIVTLLVLALATIAGRSALFGRAGAYVEMVSFSATFLFHTIPAVTETSTRHRLPLGPPLLPNADAPELKAATAVLLFVAGAAWQVLQMRKAAAGDA